MSIIWGDKEYSRLEFSKVCLESLRDDLSWVTQNYRGNEIAELDMVFHGKTEDVIYYRHFLLHEHNPNKRYLVLNGSIHSERVNNDILKNNRIEFMSLFEGKVVEHVDANYGDDVRIYKHLYFRGVLGHREYMVYITSPHSGKLKVWSGRSYRFIFPGEESRIGKGHLKGKKRPEHGDKIREKLRTYSLNRTDIHKTKLNEFLQHRYKKQRMVNLGVISKSEVDECVINNAFSEHMREYNKSTEHKKNKLRSFFKNTKYMDTGVYKSFVMKYDITELDSYNIDELYSHMMSIISSIAYMDDKNNMGSTKFFRKGTMGNLRFQRNGRDTVKYKSSYESRSIEFFEKAGVEWEYEPVFIECDTFLYKPDFYVWLDGEQYLLEVKGFIRDDAHLDKIKKQLTYSLNFCESESIKFVYVRSYIKSLDDLYDNIVDMEKIKTITK